MCSKCPRHRLVLGLLSSPLSHLQSPGHQVRLRWQEKEFGKGCLGYLCCVAMAPLIWSAVTLSQGGTSSALWGGLSKGSLRRAIT